jgi:hypothetical protein
MPPSRRGGGATGTSGGVSLRSVVSSIVGSLVLLGLLGCTAARSAPEPERVVVRHLLISFGGKIPGKMLNRSQAEAEKMALSILARARGGEDLDTLESEFSDSKAPDRYVLVNSGVDPRAGEYARNQMAPAFADVAFQLPVGGIGLCEYDAVRSPFGYHVIKRIE